MVDFDDFDLGPQSDEGFDPYEQPEDVGDDSFADGYSEAEFYGDAEMSQYDDDPSPYDGTYSEE